MSDQATGGVARLGDDEPLFSKGVSRDLLWVTLLTEPVEDWSQTIRPQLVPDRPGTDAPRKQPAGAGGFWSAVCDGEPASGPPWLRSSGSGEWGSVSTEQRSSERESRGI